MHGNSTVGENPGVIWDAPTPLRHELLAHSGVGNVAHKVEVWVNCEHELVLSW
jgi:hypothetical protein